MNNSSNTHDRKQRQYHGPPPSVSDFKRSEGPQSSTGEPASGESARGSRDWLIDLGSTNHSLERGQAELYQQPPKPPYSQGPAFSRLGDQQIPPHGQGKLLLTNVQQ